MRNVESESRNEESESRNEESDRTEPELPSRRYRFRLHAHDLVDEFWLWIFPLVLGEEKRLFADGTIPAALELTSAETSSTGVQLLRYDRAGEIEYGSFALDDAAE